MRTADAKHTDATYTFREPLGIDEITKSLVARKLTDSDKESTLDLSLARLYFILFVCQCIEQTNNTFVIPSSGSAGKILDDTFSELFFNPANSELVSAFMQAIDGLSVRISDELAPGSELPSDPDTGEKKS